MNVHVPCILEYLFHILILLCLKAARLGRENTSVHAKWHGKLEEFFARELYKYHFLVCFAAIIILLKPVVVGKHGIYEGEKGVS